MQRFVENYTYGILDLLVELCILVFLVSFRKNFPTLHTP